MTAHQRAAESRCSSCACVAGWEPLVVNLGHCYRKQQRWDDAIQVYERALGLCPGQAGTYAALGFTRHLKVNVMGLTRTLLWPIA